MSEVIIGRLMPLDIDSEVARRLQTIGFEAWQAAYTPEIPLQSIRRLFDTTNSASLEKAVQAYQAIAQVDNVAVAHIMGRANQPVLVGFAAALPELAMQPAKRAMQFVRHPLQRETISLSEINVLPQFQRLHIGRDLVHAVLDGFHDSQIVEAFLPEESVAATGLLKGLGFRKMPQDQEPVKAQTFGPLSGYVHQYRYAVPSIGIMRNRANRGI
jgi:ribosomal protein S18 acetylase RimI-like enzyme